MLLYRPRKDKRLIWPEFMWVNNLLKVIMLRKSGTAEIWTCDPQIQKPTGCNNSATAPHDILAVNWLKYIMFCRQYLFLLWCPLVLHFSTLVGEMSCGEALRRQNAQRRNVGNETPCRRIPLINVSRTRPAYCHYNSRSLLSIRFVEF